MARITSGNYATTLGPAWAGDYGNREHVVPGGARVNPAAFLIPDAVIVTVGAAGAAGGATSVPVDALSGAIPSGTVLSFGTNKFARLTANAAAGATSLTVAAIPTALVDNDTATYAGAGVLKKFIPSGTVVGRTIAERDALTGYGPAADADDEIFLLLYDVTDADLNADCELYRHGGIVKENFLPVFSALSTALKAALRSKYQCTIGAN